MNFKETNDKTVTCFNCNSKHLIKFHDETEFKYFCTVCGSEYMIFVNDVKGGSITEEKTINIGTKKWKPKRSKTIYTSFISNEESKNSFIKFCESGIKKFELEAAEYTFKIEDNLYEKYNLITNTKSYIKPVL